MTDINNDWHTQPKENTIPKKERGIPRWLFYGVLLIIAGVFIVKAYINITKPVGEKAYDIAVSLVEVAESGSKIEFKEYSERYLVWLNDSTVLVKVPVTITNNYGIEVESVYQVRVEIKDGECFPGTPYRTYDYDVTEEPTVSPL